ncbi:MAG TPA: glycosyltransferase family 1 protein [Solirubrobacteraceae bacterium]|nr:glycosyltransferase family 1 protein [Solirubrobacteraceae bacterium]
MPSPPHEPLNVLVDAVSARSGGGATFLFEQLRALDRIVDVNLTIITTEAAYAAVRGGCPHSNVTSWPVRPLPIRILREQAAIPRLATNYDVVYVPGNFASARARVPQVLVLQSLWHFGRQARAIRRHCPPAMRMRLAAESALARASVHKADRVICVSETMRSCVAEDLGSLEKITVIPAAAPRLPVGVGQRQLPGPYVLSVGTDLPHKDWTGLIRAFERRDDLPPLVLVGWCSPARRRVLASCSRPESVRVLGPVTDRRELADLYRHASCVVAHSHLESYGLTAIEALSVEAPLAASDISAHREFCGPAAHYYDPRDGEAMTTAVAEAIRSGPAVTRAPALALTWADNADMTAYTLRSAATRRIHA